MIDDSLRNNASERDIVIRLHILKIFHKIALKFG